MRSRYFARSQSFINMYQSKFSRTLSVSSSLQ